MILSLLAYVGATLILVRGTIFERLQRTFALFRCAQCTGFWVGVLGGATQIVPVGHGPFVDAIFVGATVSFLSTLADALLVALLGEPDK